MKTFSVTATIRATPEVIWGLLTDAPHFPSWNETVTKVDGRIAKGEKITVHAKISPNRAFPVEVAEFEPGRRMGEGLLRMVEFEAALDAFHAGDAEGLERLLRAHPSLVHARVTSAEGHYSGYFHEATLLHHVAGNPFIRPLPMATTERARATAVRSRRDVTPLGRAARACRGRVAPPRARRGPHGARYIVRCHAPRLGRARGTSFRGGASGAPRGCWATSPVRPSAPPSRPRPRPP